MFWFEAHTLPHVFVQLAHECAGKPVPIQVVTGKVKAWTRWGARRLIRKRYGRTLLTIPYVGTEPPEGRR